MRNKFSNFYLIGVYADKDIRWNRLKKDYDYNERLFNEAEERDQGEYELYGQQVRVCMDIADIIIVNNEDFTGNLSKKSVLHNKIDEYIKLINLPGIRKPILEEINMNKAYISSLRSDCLKRQVGAVIVEGKEGRIISEGCNRIPSDNIPKCIEREKGCHRDEKRDELIDELDVDSDVLKEKLKMLDLCRVLHAEEDAIINALKHNFKNFENSKLYTTTFPCLMCAIKIIAVGIKNITFVEPYPVEMSRIILREANVNIKIFEGVKHISLYKLFKKERDFYEKIKKK